MWRYVHVAGEDVDNSVCFGTKFAVAKVKSSTTIPGQSGYDEIDGEKRFDVTITKMYTKNGVEKFEKGWETSLFAPMASSMCGYIALKTGKTYYISVYGGDGRLTFNGCSFASTKEELTDVQRKIIKGELTCPSTEPIFPDINA